MKVAPRCRDICIVSLCRRTRSGPFLRGHEVWRLRKLAQVILHEAPADAFESESHLRAGGASKYDRRHPSGCSEPLSNATPMCRSLRQITRQGWPKCSPSTLSLKWSGIKSGVSTSRAAPEADRFLTVQRTALPSKMMEPAFSTRRRRAIRFSFAIGAG